MKLHCKRAAAVFLALVMTLAMVPATAFAAEAGAASYTVTGEGFDDGADLKELVTKGFDGLEVKVKDQPAKDAMTADTYHHIGFEKISETRGDDKNAVYKAVMTGSTETGSTHYYVSSLGFSVNQPCYVVFDFYGNGRATQKSANGYKCAGQDFSTLPSSPGSMESITDFGFSTSGKTVNNKVSYGKNGEYTSDQDSSIVDDQNWMTGVAYLDEGYQSLVFMDTCKVKNVKTHYAAAFISNVRFYKTIDDVPIECKSNITFKYNPEHMQDDTVSITVGSNSNQKPYTDDDKNGEIKVTVPLWHSVKLAYTIKDGVSNNFFDGVVYMSSDYAWYFTDDSYDGFDLDFSSTKNANSTTSYITIYPVKHADCTFEARTAYPSTKPESITLEYSSDGEQWNKVDWGSGKTNIIETGNDYFYYQTRHGMQDNLQFRLGVKDPEGAAHKTTVQLNGQVLEDPKSEENGFKYYKTTTEGKDKTFIVTAVEDGKDPNVYKILLWSTLTWQEAFDTADNQVETLTSDWAFDFGNSSSRPFLYDYDFWNRAENLIPDPKNPEQKIVDAESQEKYPIVFRTGLTEGAHRGSVTFTCPSAGLLSFDYKLSESGKYSFYVRRTRWSADLGNGNGGDVIENIVSMTDVSNLEGGAVDWQHFEIPVDANKTVTIEYTDDTQKDGYAAVSNLNYQTGSVTINATVGDGSSEKGTVEISEGNGNTYYVGQNVTLTAKPSGSNVFVGWYDENDQVVSRDAVWTWMVKGEQAAKGTLNYTAKFADPQQNNFQVGENFYNDLAEALQKAGENQNDKDKLVRQLQDYTLTKPVEIPDGVTLLIPCINDDPGYTETGYNPNGTKANGGQSDKTRYRTLTVDSGATITIQDGGTLLVNAVTGHNSSNAPMDITGGYGQITLNGEIVVEDGGILDVFGIVSGTTGKVTVKKGGTARDLYLVDHWRGGTQAANVFPKVFPINQFHMHHIEVPTTIEAGGNLIGTVKMNAQTTYYYTRFPQIGGNDGDTNALIRVNEGGQVVKTYIPQSDAKTWEFGKEKFVLTGGGVISSSILTIPILGDASTAYFLYAVDGDMDYDISGNWTVNESFKFFPGAVITLKEDAQLTLEKMSARYGDTDNKVNSVVLYDDETFDDNNPPVLGGTAYPDGRGDSKLVMEGGSKFTVNGNFAGLISIDESATEDKPATITFASDIDTTVTVDETNGHGQGTKQLTFKANIDGWTGLTAGKTYTCWKENGVTVIKEAADGSENKPFTYGDDVKWAGEGSFEYKPQAGEWGTEAPKAVGTYSVRKVTASNDSYKLVENLGTLTVNELVAEFALDESGFTYNESEHTVTAKVTNTKYDDNLTVTLEGDVTKTDVGQYTATVKEINGEGAENYTLEGATTTLPWSIAAKQEETPSDLGIDYSGYITGLTAGQKYKVNGTEYTAEDGGKIAIQDAWYGTNVTVVKCGDGVNTADSAATELEIPARPAAPTVDHTDASSSSASDGTITVTGEDGKSYEYSVKDSGVWTVVPEGGVISELAAGTYEVREKQGENSFAGTPVTVSVTYPTPRPSTPSSTTETVTNPDGSTTTTTTQADGTKTETTKQTDGTVTEKVTQPDGSATEKTTTPEGVTGQTNTDAEGKVTSAEVVIPESAEEQDVVTAPVEVPAAKSAEEAPEITVKTGSEDTTKVEIPVTDFGPGTVAVVVHEDGTEEVVRDCVIGENGVVLNVEGDVTLKIVDNTETFVDVEPVNHWATDAVEFVAARELFRGTTENTFSPEEAMTRGMLVTVLHRLAYEPEAVEDSFNDVSSSAYYAEAVSWAESNDIVSGYGNGAFGPEDKVSREQLVTILYRYAEKNGYTMETGGSLAGFTDASTVSGYAVDAMAWAVEVGLIRGVDDTLLAPSSKATRAQVATILMRFCELVTK